MNDVMKRRFHEYLLESEKSRQKLARREFAMNIIDGLSSYVSNVLNSLRSGNILYNPKYDKEFYFNLVRCAFARNKNKPLGLGDFITYALSKLTRYVIEEYEKENAHFESIKLPEESKEAQADDV
jgi:hypothetical protein